MEDTSDTDEPDDTGEDCEPEVEVCDGVDNACAAPSGYAGSDTDCDDDNADIYPGAMEICDDDNGTDAGAAYLILGGVSGNLDLSKADARLTGANGSDYAGRAVAGGGDINGDGLSDILVGAWGEDTGGSAAGATYLVFGGGY